MTAWTFEPIGFIQSCFNEKFGVPRQALMVTEARGLLKLKPDPAYLAALKHLEGFSHIWIVYVFHLHDPSEWRPMIRPPRIDAPRKVGVFASRSPHRPNPIGLSAVKLERIDLQAPGGIELHLSGIDIMDGTPVLDIKPYLPYADSIPEANPGWAGGMIPRYKVGFSKESHATIRAASLEENCHPDLERFITQMLELDPRPMSQRRAMPLEDPASEGMLFAFRILEFDVHWQVKDHAIHVVRIDHMTTGA